MHKLRDMAQQYKVPIPNLIEIYSNLQTKYLRRDLDKGLYTKDLFECNAYGNKALEVMDRYMRMKSK